MNFCDKLQKIRKENNITQEGLADKLGVSRQAVSKWESGDSYPDTEKLIQISKLFKISLDELINDNVDTSKINNKNKFNFMETFDIAFESIRKVWSMFFAMKFWEKVKFLIEMALVVVGIYLTALLVDSIILNIIRRIFAFLPYQIFNVIDYIAYTLLYIVWIILGTMFFIRVLKTRYLDYYVIIKDDTVERMAVEEPIKELKEKKETKIVIRDPDDSGSFIFKKIANLFLILFKCFALILLIPIVITFIALIILFVISLMYLFSGIFFNGITLAILGVICFNFLLTKFLYNVIFNQRISYAKMFIVFIASISLMGIGIGLSFIGINDFETYSENTGEKYTKEITMNMQDNLILYEINDIDEEKIVINDDIDNIKLTIDTYDLGEPSIFTYSIFNHDDNVYTNYEIANITINQNGLKIYKSIVDDLKHKRININNFNSTNYSITKIEISRKNLNKIKENIASIDE